MATLPSIASLTGASTTNAQQKTNFSDQRTFLADLLGTDSGNKTAARTALGVPALTDFASSLSGNGWQKLAGGMILQYGVGGTASNGYLRVNFPIAFPTAARAVFCTGNGTDFTNMTFQVGTLTTTYVDVRSATGSNTPLAVSFNWFAIGY